MESPRSVLRAVHGLTAGALALFAGAALWAGRSGETRSAPLPPQVVSGVVEVRGPMPSGARESVEAGSAPSQALGMSRLLLQSGCKILGEDVLQARSPDDIRLWEARENLRETLQRNPQAWEDVLDFLASGSGLEVSLRVVVLARAAVNDRAEVILVRTLRTKGDSGLRQLAVAGLGHRDTPGALDALVSAAGGDANAGVRLAAVKALAELKDATASLDVRAAIDQFFHQRARQESEIQVRDPIRRLLGEEVAPALAARPPQPGSRRILVGVPSASR